MFPQGPDLMVTTRLRLVFASSPLRRWPRGLAMFVAVALLAVAGAPVAFGQAEEDFFKLYQDWRTKQTADYNLDGLVNYWDAMCLSYHWAGVTQRRFYMAGGGTGIPIDVLRAEPGNPGGFGFNTIIARPFIDVTRADAGSGEGKPIVIALPAIQVVRADNSGTQGLATNIVVAHPDVQIARADNSGTQGLAPNTVVAHPDVQVARADNSGTQGLTTNTVVAHPDVNIVRADSGGTEGLAPNLVVARPPVSVSREASGKARVVLGAASDPIHDQNGISHP